MLLFLSLGQVPTCGLVVVTVDYVESILRVNNMRLDARMWNFVNARNVILDSNKELT